MTSTISEREGATIIDKEEASRFASWSEQTGTARFYIYSFRQALSVRREDDTTEKARERARVRPRLRFRSEKGEEEAAILDSGKGSLLI